MIINQSSPDYYQLQQFANPSSNISFLQYENNNIMVRCEREEKKKLSPYYSINFGFFQLDDFSTGDGRDDITTAQQLFRV